MVDLAADLLGCMGSLQKATAERLETAHAKMEAGAHMGPREKCVATTASPLASVP